MKRAFLLFLSLGGVALTFCAVPGKRASAPEFPPELVNWVEYPGNPIFSGTGENTWDRQIRERGWILIEDGVWRLYYTGYNDSVSSYKYLGLATSRDGIHWERYPGNPIYDRGWVEDVCVVKRNGTYYMFAEGKGDTAHMLTSPDGLHWTEQGNLDIRLTNGKPISPGPYGTPTVWIEGDTWYLFYERRDLGVWLATSRDLKTWVNVQDDPVLPLGPQACDIKQIAVDQIVRYKGRYYAYYHGFGEKPWDNWGTCLAVSRDLVHWKKFPGNPIIFDHRDSAVLVRHGGKLRLYVMHPAVRLYLPAGKTNFSSEPGRNLQRGF